MILAGKTPSSLFRNQTGWTGLSSRARRTAIAAGFGYGIQKQPEIAGHHERTARVASNGQMRFVTRLEPERSDRSSSDPGVRLGASGQFTTASAGLGPIRAPRICARAWQAGRGLLSSSIGFDPLNPSFRRRRQGAPRGIHDLYQSSWALTHQNPMTLGYNRLVAQ